MSVQICNRKNIKADVSRQGSKQYLGMMPEVKVVGPIRVPEKVKPLRLLLKTSEPPQERHKELLAILGI